MLDESPAVLAAAWSGEPVRHRGEHDTVDDPAFLPRPVQRPGVPVWAAGFPGDVMPIRRAARLDGFFPADLEHPDQVAEVFGSLAALRRGRLASYDIAVGLPSVSIPNRTREPAPRGGCQSGNRVYGSTPCGAYSATAPGVRRRSPCSTTTRSWLAITSDCWKPSTSAPVIVSSTSAAAPA
ncbi:LLM class flavin-dependent oxidoreductase [Streptomyces sp. NPDC050759]|uniref:LLM class flavin-dependent oxidoreductase n=1 Tax=Streptomyces sp. NPDC050759 TaxID=3365635 RepID=UPI0037BC2DA8